MKRVHVEGTTRIRRSMCRKVLEDYEGMKVVADGLDMVNRTYYAAVREGKDVTAYVMPFEYHTKEEDGFAYTLYSEDDCPLEFSHCPAEVFAALTPRKTEGAYMWRGINEDIAALTLDEKKNLSELRYLKDGTTIKAKVDGDLLILTKLPDEKYGFLFYDTASEDRYMPGFMARHECFVVPAVEIKGTEYYVDRPLTVFDVYGLDEGLVA